jgi:phospholipase C
VFGGYDDSNSSRVAMDGFAAFEADKENAAENKYCSVMSGFKASDLPVLNSLAAEFAVFDRFFASVPGVSNSTC